MASKHDQSVDRGQLVESHRGLVRALAWRLRCRLPRGVDVQELSSLGHLGLAKAASSYDPKIGAFSTYAYHRIRGEMLDGIRKSSRIDYVSFEAGEYQESLSPQGATDAVDTAISLEMRRQLHEAMMALPAEVFELVYLTYFDGLSLAAAAEKLGYSRSWASRVHGRAIRLLRERLVPEARGRGS